MSTHLTAAVVGLTLVCVGLGIYARVLKARLSAARAASQPDQRVWVCEACGKPHRSEAEALFHARDRHGAPDEENARYIITEA